VSIVVATGFDLFNASLLHEFGYSSDPDILTSYELERMLNASGPTDGEIIKPSNGKHPEKVLFVLCAGRETKDWCRTVQGLAACTR